MELKKSGYFFIPYLNNILTTLWSHALLYVWLFIRQAQA